MNKRTPPTWEFFTDIEWCKTELKRVQAGGETAPYSYQEWLAIIEKRIQHNITMLKQYGVIYKSDYPERIL